METRFILPVTVAATLHALLLFGVRWPHDTAGLIATAVVKPGPTAPTETIEMRDEVVTDPNETPPAPRGSRTEARAAAEDPVREWADSDILQPPQPPAPKAKHNVRVIEPGGPGLPDGSPDAIGWSRAPIIDSGKLDHPPHKRVQVAPIYPADARKEGRTAEVVVEFVVDERGAVAHARVVRSTDAAFEAATLQAVGKWRFEPGLKNGRPVRFRMLMPVVFMLTD